MFYWGFLFFTTLLRQSIRLHRLQDTHWVHGTPRLTLDPTLRRLRFVVSLSRQLPVEQRLRLDLACPTKCLTGLIQLLIFVPYKPTTAIKNKLMWKGGRLEDHFGCFGLPPHPSTIPDWVVGLSPREGQEQHERRHTSAFLAFDASPPAPVTHPLRRRIPFGLWRRRSALLHLFLPSPFPRPECYTPEISN